MRAGSRRWGTVRKYENRTPKVAGKAFHIWGVWNLHVAMATKLVSLYSGAHLVDSNPLGIKQFVSSISISFKCECYIVMQMKHMKNHNPDRFKLGRHWVSQNSPWIKKLIHMQIGWDILFHHSWLKFGQVNQFAYFKNLNIFGTDRKSVV